MQTRDMNLQLVAIFLEKGFTLDFDPATGKARPEATVALESEIYRQYLEDPDTCLFSLAFLNDLDGLSTSVVFLAQVAATFIERLAKMADVEYAREETLIAPTDDDIAALLAGAPHRGDECEPKMSSLVRFYAPE